LSVLTYTYLYSIYLSILPFLPIFPTYLLFSSFSSQYSRIIRPRTFYRSGWLRCVVRICIGWESCLSMCSRF
jgi:sulfite exporter TauE/SafE